MSDQPRQVRTISAPHTPAHPLAQAGPKSLRTLLAIISVVVLVVSGAGWLTVGRVGDQLASGQNLDLGDVFGGKHVSAKHGEAADGATDILLVGSDSRSDAQGNPLTPDEVAMLRAGDEQNDNTDTLMVIRVPNDGSSATAISIPRDTYIHDPEMGNIKINGVYAAYKNDRMQELLKEGVTDQKELEDRSKEAGRAALIRAISRLTGVTVDHYAEIGLLGFVLMTNAVGGVEVCLNNPVKDEYSHADFPAGRQTLDGPDALSFVRQRHGLPRGDLDRITRQQAYMASLVNKVLSNSTLKNPAKLKSLADAALRSVIIDDGWDIMSFANQLQNLAGGKVKFATIPVTSIDGVGDNGESVVTIDPKQVHDFFDKLLGTEKGPTTATPTTTSAAPTPKSVTVHVLNATNTTGLATAVASALKNEGYPIGEISNAQPGLYSGSQVLAANTSDPDAVQLAHDLGGLPIRQAASLSSGEAVAVIDSDYKGPKDESAVTTTPSSVVGQPGEAPAPPTTPVIDAGGNGPRCVN